MAGTIFLDEVGELPLELQAKLLRVLQEKEVRPVGSNQRVKVDVRVIAATNRDLEAAYKNGTFRKDLYFRLNVVTLFVPALRERRSDIPMLVHWFLERYARGQEMHVTSAAMKALMQYDWPGNVRELENCVERAVALGNGQGIDLGDLPPGIASGAHVGEPEIRKTAILDPDLGERLVDPGNAAPLRLYHRSGRHRTSHHSTGIRAGEGRQSSGRTHAGHQPRDSIPQAEALQHRHERPGGSSAHFAVASTLRATSAADRRITPALPVSMSRSRRAEPWKRSHSLKLADRAASPDTQ